MHRLAWTAWGLLVVVLDLPLGLWDVVADLVGWAWVWVGLTGATAAPFVRARWAAVAGLPVAVVVGTPLSAASLPLTWASAVADVLLVAAVVHQLCAGLIESVGARDAQTATWAGRLRVGALVLAVAGLAGLAGFALGAGAVLLLGQLVSTVVGVLTVVLLQRVSRSGLLAAG